MDLLEVTVADKLLSISTRKNTEHKSRNSCDCLLYTSDAADERSSVDLGGRRIIKKKNRVKAMDERANEIETKQTYMTEYTWYKAQIKKSSDTQKQ